MKTRLSVLVLPMAGLLLFTGSSQAAISATIAQAFENRGIYDSELGTWEVNRQAFGTDIALGDSFPESGLDELGNALYVFELPDLGGESIQSVTFQFNVNTIYGAPGSVGVFGDIHVDAEYDHASFFGTGSFAGPGQASGGTYITETGAIGGTGAVPVDVTSYFNTITYNAGEFVYFRLGVELDNTNLTDNTYIIDGPMSPNPGGATLSITTVPEVSTVALLAGGLALGYVLSRRRRR